MKMHYGYKWSWHTNELTVAWDESQARKAHARRKIYTVLVEVDQIPFCVLEFNDKFVGVGFLDRQMRFPLRFGFFEVEPKRLFLSETSRFMFSDETEIRKRITTCMFKPNGEVNIVHDLLESRTQEYESHHCDVAKNWDVYPEFGEYESLIREDRFDEAVAALTRFRDG